MPTPFMPDEEFDARFRQGLEQYPEQPATPAAWHRMELLLDADQRQQALRRQMLRLLGAETVLLALVIWSILYFVTSHIPLHPAGATLASATQPTTLTAVAPAASRALPAARSQALLATRPVASLLPAARPALLPSSAGPAASATLASRPQRVAGGQRMSAGNLQAVSVEARRQPMPATALALASHTRRRRAHTNEVANAPASIAVESATATQRTGAALASRSRRLRQPTRPVVGLGATEAATAQPLVTLARRSRPARPATVARRPGHPAQAGSQATDAASAAGSIDSLRLRPASLLLGLVVRRPDSLARVALPASGYPADTLARSRPAAWTAYRLRLGLVGSPELSTVRDVHRTGLGGGVGGQLDYQFARRWHLSAAYLVTLKRYAARPEDYHLPDYVVLPPGWVISDVDAVCRIVDIPLNLRYDLWQRPSHQWFVSAGLSSLLMKRERYTYYYYPDPSGTPIDPFALELLNGSQHVLKVVNLSAGYERVLGRRWTLQAEPFVKLPLGGVGYGAVRLSSAGVFFSLRYGLLPRPPAVR